MENKTKITTQFVIKENKELPEGDFEGIISNPKMDRDGESIDVDGITMAKGRNMPLTWVHNYLELPLGIVKKVWREGKNLMGRFHIDYDLGEFERKVYEKIKRGSLGALSIGGIPVERDPKDFYKISKMEMYEVAVVPIGAHPDALITNKALEGKEEDKDYKDFIERALRKKFGGIKEDALQKHIETLKTLTSALEAQYKEASVEPENTKEVGDRVVRKRLVLTRTTAKQVDKAAEAVIAGLNLKIKLK